MLQFRELWAFWCLIASTSLAYGYGLQVIDEADGRGIPMATVRLGDGSVSVTDSAGWVHLAEPGLAGHRVRLQITAPGYTLPENDRGQPDVAVDLTPQGEGEVKLIRLDIARRIYRVTGSGIYRDSELLGKDVPLPLRNQAVGLLSATGVQRAQLGNQVLWLWRDTRLAHESTAAVLVRGAFSDLPGAGGLDPTQGIHFSFLTGAKDGLKSLLQGDEPSAAWIEGLTAVEDQDGRPVLAAHYVLEATKAHPREHGIAIWTADKRFERVVVLGEEYLWQFPAGQAVTVEDEEVRRCYFANPFCNVRCPATLEAIRNPAAYEALTRPPGDNRDPIWQQTLPPMTQREESTWIAEGRVTTPLGQVEDHATGKAVPIAHASIHWNAYHRCYAMIASSIDGDLWLSTSARPIGPWKKAVRVVQAMSGRCTEPVQHPFMSQEGGRIIWFESALVDTGAARYEQNQVMHRLDMDDPRLQPALVKN
jgi:hypothetical protein